MRDWNGREIAAGESRSGVTVIADFADNLIRRGNRPWPPPAIVQKLYESRHGGRLPPEVRELVRQRLGFYSDLQSVHSEDAITWSYFGPLAGSDEGLRGRFLDWLLERLGVTTPHHTSCTIDLWRRVPHPDKPLPGGPELDFIVDGEHCVVFGEAKWLSPEGVGQGKAGDKTQLQLRREFLEKYGRRIYGQRVFVVLGLDLEGTFAEAATEAARSGPVIEAGLTWRDLGEFEHHPAAAEFRRYLAWKGNHSMRRRRGRSGARAQEAEVPARRKPIRRPKGPGGADFSRRGLEARGFEGFRSFRRLAAGGLGDVPIEAGIYVVVRGASRDPEFLAESIGGHFKAENPTVAIDVLAQNWVDGADLLYVGKATSLKRRLSEFVRFGQGKPVGHRGGRLIWQLAGAEELLVAWKTTPGEPPEAAERDLIGEFQAAHDDRLPFANLR